MLSNFSSIHYIIKKSTTTTEAGVSNMWTCDEEFLLVIKIIIIIIIIVFPRNNNTRPFQVCWTSITKKGYSSGNCVSSDQVVTVEHVLYIIVFH